MDTRPFDPYNPAIFEVPVPPQEFGQDGGKFYNCYDALAEEIDENMVTSLKEQLDGLLIFAGLFAGINTAFLAFTLPLMSSDPADDTNALLRDILSNLASGRNDSLPTLNSLPSETFSPTGKILTVNVLFSVSLAIAIVSSFLAVLGRQWLVYYRKRTGGGPESQRWEQLKRFLGATRWQLEWVLDDFLPSLLQIGLIIFCISLAIYLSTLHPMLSNVVGAFMGAGLAILVITGIFATWDKFCPFQSPLSHTLSRLLPLMGSTAIVLAFIILVLIWILLIWPFKLLLGTINALHSYYAHGPHSVTPPWAGLELYWGPGEILSGYFIHPIVSVLDYVKRKEEGDGILQIIAIGRAICTSDDARTQTYAVANILGITDGHLLSQLATYEDLDIRISRLARSSYHRIIQLWGRDRSNLAAETSWLYRAAITHTRLLAADPEESQWFAMGATDWEDNNESMVLLSSDIIHRAPPNMLTAWLGYLAESQNKYPSQARHLALGFIIDELVNPSWRCISMAIVTITVMWGVNESDHQILHAAYTGKPSVAVRNLNLVVEKSNGPHCQDRDALRKYLFKILNFTGKAAIASSTDSSVGPNGVATVLRFLERLIRAQDSSSDLINFGRNLRGELISALQSECEKLSEKYGKYTSKEALDDLIQLFTELTRLAPDHISDERPTRTLSWDDKELVQLFSPILPQLDTIVIKNDWQGRIKPKPDYLEFRRQVEELKFIFANFEAVVKNSAARAREMKRRSREPDLRWCYYYE